jgi:hypothetical protein
MARAPVLEICHSLLASDHDPRKPLEASLRLAAVGAVAKRCWSHPEHISFGFVPRERNVARRFPSHACCEPVFGGLRVEAIRAIFELKFTLPAFGSSRVSFAHGTAYDLGWWQRLSRKHGPKARPRQIAVSRTLCRCRSNVATSVVIGRWAFSTPPFCHEA